jgi:hypothetical protein
MHCKQHDEVGTHQLRVLGELSIGAHGNELHLEILAATSANDDAGRHTCGLPQPCW